MLYRTIVLLALRAPTSKSLGLAQEKIRIKVKACNECVFLQNCSGSCLCCWFLGDCSLNASFLYLGFSVNGDDAFQQDLTRVKDFTCRCVLRKIVLKTCKAMQIPVFQILFFICSLKGL